MTNFIQTKLKPSKEIEKKTTIKYHLLLYFQDAGKQKFDWRSFSERRMLLATLISQSLMIGQRLSQELPALARLAYAGMPN